MPPSLAVDHTVRCERTAEVAGHDVVHVSDGQRLRRDTVRLEQQVGVLLPERERHLNSSVRGFQWLSELVDPTTLRGV